MKKLIFCLFLIVSAYLIIDHGRGFEDQEVEIDQLMSAYFDISKDRRPGQTIGFVSNSNDDMYVHFMSQFAVAPLLIEKAEPFRPDTLIYLKENNLAPREDLQALRYDTLSKHTINRGIIYILTKK